MDHDLVLLHSPNLDFFFQIAYYFYVIEVANCGTCVILVLGMLFSFQLPLQKKNRRCAYPCLSHLYFSDASCHNKGTRSPAPKYLHITYLQDRPRSFVKSFIKQNVDILNVNFAYFKNQSY